MQTEPKNNAWAWANAFADSLIKIAAAVMIVVISYTNHFKADPVEQAVKHTALMMETFATILDNRSNFSPQICDLSKLDSRFLKLEGDSHPPNTTNK